MIGLIMSGGKGSRMKPVREKLLLKFKKPVIHLVLNAFEKSEIFSRIVCVTSRNAPKTRKFIMDLGFETLETQGIGYVEDLNEAVLNFNEPVFVASGDLPLLDSKIIKKIVNLINPNNSWTSILVREKFLDSIGIKGEFFVTVDEENCAYTGISLINPKKFSGMQQVKESFIILDDKRIAINLNTKRDCDLLCAT